MRLDVDEEMTMASISNKTELVRAVKATGSHFFDADTMRFFRSRIEVVYPTAAGAVFVTSEQFDDGTARRYSVRSFDGERIVEHAPKVPENFPHRHGFQTFAKFESAKRYAKTIVKQLKRVHA